MFSNSVENAPRYSGKYVANVTIIDIKKLTKQVHLKYRSQSLQNIKLEKLMIVENLMQS